MQIQQINLFKVYLVVTPRHLHLEQVSCAAAVNTELVFRVLSACCWLLVEEIIIITMEVANGNNIT